MRRLHVGACCPHTRFNHHREAAYVPVHLLAAVVWTQTQHNICVRAFCGRGHSACTVWVLRRRGTFSCHCVCFIRHSLCSALRLLFIKHLPGGWFVTSSPPAGAATLVLFCASFHYASFACAPMVRFAFAIPSLFFSVIFCASDGVVRSFMATRGGTVLPNRHPLPFSYRLRCVGFCLLPAPPAFIFILVIARSWALPAYLLLPLYLPRLSRCVRLSL